MSTGLKDELGLGEPKPQGSTAQADKFKADFQAQMSKVNECLQYTAAHAEQAKHDPQAAKRETAYSAYQTALGRIDPANPAVAQGAIDKVLAAIKALLQAVQSLKQAVEKAFNAWTDREPELDTAADQIREMVEWEHDKAGELQQIVDAIQSKANLRKWEEALQALEQLLQGLRPIFEEFLRQKAAQTEYEAGLAALEPKLAEAATCEFASLEAMQQEITMVADQMRQAAESKDYVTAVEVLADLSSKLEAYETALKELEEQKLAFETALAALTPRLPTTCSAYQALAPMEEEIATIQGQMEAAAEAANYVEALRIATDLGAKVDAYEAALQKLEEQKQAYETALGALTPRLPTTCSDAPALAAIEEEMTAIQGQMETAAEAGNYEEALQMTTQLAAKLDDYETAVELEQKKQAYEEALAALTPRLPTTCPVSPKLGAMHDQIMTLKGQMEAAATSQDYEQALQMATQLTAKLDEYEKASEELEQQKQAYEQALQALQPRLPTTCPANPKLGVMHDQIMALKGQMEAAATSEDYEGALKIATQLSAKVDEYEKAVKDAEPPSAEQVKEVKDLIAAGKKNEAIAKAIEYYGVDKSQAKSIVFDSAVSGEAVASKDGSVKVGNDAFSSPGWLASSMAHELEVHVNQQAKKGKWYTGKMGTAIQEVQAYDHEIANAHKYGLTEAEIKSLKRRRTQHYNQLNATYKTRADGGNYDMKPGEEGL